MFNFKKKNKLISIGACLIFSACTFAEPVTLSVASAHFSYPQKQSMKYNFLSNTVDIGLSNATPNSLDVIVQNMSANTPAYNIGVYEAVPTAPPQEPVYDSLVNMDTPTALSQFVYWPFLPPNTQWVGIVYDFTNPLNIQTCFSIRSSGLQPGARCAIRFKALAGAGIGGEIVKIAGSNTQAIYAAVAVS